ncbi:DinB family protein [Segetibacter sp. 3557_3]|uniref:DinB family protein n=1 Tax=Segetibacter sp. 3557_3 TaxID=2547429 RepID=UPI001058FD33|nr:DinB family protein [Segetibacter sp. 3557_3]TDH20663.1 DinB family protein [Segetibacter sp. 3557_3]
MKSTSILLSVLLLLAFKTKDNPLTQAERNYASTSLNTTALEVASSIKGLSNAQLKFKPGPDKWSIEECMKHIAVSEKNLWNLVETSLKQPANPEKRIELKNTDEQVIKGGESRENKVKTFDALKPENTSFTSAAHALTSFTESREKLIAFVNSTTEDLRNHVTILPMGSFDAYQLILLISSHSKRHTKQIDEVKADPNFPKS